MAQRALGTEPRLVLRRGSRYEAPARAGEWRTPEETSFRAPSTPAVDVVPDADVGARAEKVPPPVGATAAMPAGEVTTLAGGAADAVPQPSLGPVDAPSGDRAAPLGAGPVPAVTPGGGSRSEDRGRAGSDTVPGGDDKPSSPGDEASDAAVVASLPGEPASASPHAGITGDEPERPRSAHPDTRPSGTGSPPPSSVTAPVVPVAGRTGTVGAGTQGGREPDFVQALGPTPPTSHDAADSHGLRDAGRPPAATRSSADREGRRQAGRTGHDVDAGSSAQRPSHTRPPDRPPSPGTLHS